MRMLVFPYGRDCEAIIRHVDLLKPCYDIVALVSPGGWGLAGKDVTLGNRGKTLVVHEFVEEVTEQFDTLFIPTFEVIDDEVEERLTDEILKLIPRLSHIICVAQLNDVNRNKLKKLCAQTDSSCDFLDFSVQNKEQMCGVLRPIEKDPPLKLLDVPVVVVAGMWEKTDKFEISLSLRERFLQKGYCLSQIGSRNGCELFGFHSFPEFMFCKDIDAVDKIIYFNRRVGQIVREEQPDLVLITIPGAMHNFSEQFTKGFGILHYQVFQAVLPDAFVMCTFYMPDAMEALEEMSLSCKYRFDALVDVFHMSNLFVDINGSEESKRIITNSIYRETVDRVLAQRYTDSPIPVFNGLNEEECNRIFDVLVEKLTPKDTRAVF